MVTRPYRLQHMLSAVHDTVFLVESERDADRLIDARFVATTAAGCEWSSELAAHFRAKLVHILPSNSPQAHAEAEFAARHLHRVADEVRIVRLPVPQEAGVAAFLDDPTNSARLVDLCRATPPWLPDPSPLAPDEIATAATYAQALGGNGYFVFPCRADKRPATLHGFKDAVRDPVQVAELWRQHSGPLVGVATGAVSGIDVLDIDVKHDEARAWWARNRERLLPTWMYRTRSGGLHLWFIHSAGLGSSANRIARGVDVRGDGGYVICWPCAGLPVIDPEATVAPWPSWLLDALRPKPAIRASFAAPAPTEAHADAAIAGACRVAAEAAEGNRNAALFWAACRLGEHALAGRIAAAAAEQMLVAAARAAGLPDREARATIGSAWRRLG